jgi:hypothetical protein
MGSRRAIYGLYRVDVCGCSDSNDKTLKTFQSVVRYGENACVGFCLRNGAA